VWRVEEETLESAPAALKAKLEKLEGQTFLSEEEAEVAILAAGFVNKEVKAALKVIATTDPVSSPIAGKKHAFEPDSELRDNENISLPLGFISFADSDRLKVVKELAEMHLTKEIHPYVPDAWIDHSKTKIGYEIPFTRHFYTYSPPRPVEEIKAEIQLLESQIQELMKDLK
jgi:type I restriction enzyme M protein